LRVLQLENRYRHKEAWRLIACTARIAGRIPIRLEPNRSYPLAGRWQAP